MSDRGEILVVYVDGVMDVQNLGDNLSTTYFTYERGAAGEPAKIPAIRLVRPKSSLINADCGIAKWAAAEPDPRLEGIRKIAGH